jgi:glutamate racemase
MKIHRIGACLLVALMLGACGGRNSESRGAGTAAPPWAEKDALTVVVTDSGLGGLSIAAAAAARLKKVRAYRSVNLVFANALFSNESGYNSLPDRESKIRVFDSALQGIEKTVHPNLILVGCNTLSVLIDDVPFAKTGPIPIVGIVEAGVELIARALEGAPEASVILFGTETTIAEGSHKQKLLARGIAESRIVPQACPELASYIENDFRADDTGLLISAYVDEGLNKLPDPKSPLFAALVCTHYGYARDAWTKAFAERGANLQGILDPNETLVDAVFPASLKSRFPETAIHARVISKVEIAENKRKTLGEWLARTSPEVAAALAHYELIPDLFSLPR